MVLPYSCTSKLNWRTWNESRCDRLLHHTCTVHTYVCILPTGDGSWSSQLGASIRLRRLTVCHKFTLHVFTCIELSNCTLLVYLYGSHHSYVRTYVPTRLPSLLWSHSFIMDTEQSDTMACGTWHPDCWKRVQLCHSWTNLQPNVGKSSLRAWHSLTFVAGRDAKLDTY